MANPSFTAGIPGFLQIRVCETFKEHISTMTTRQSKWGEKAKRPSGQEMCLRGGTGPGQSLASP